VLLPNLYYRVGRDTIYGPSVHEEGSAEHKRMRAARTKMTIPPVMDDVAAMLSFADRQNEVKKGPVECHGYCMSGPYALAAAARYPVRAGWHRWGDRTLPRRSSRLHLPAALVLRQAGRGATLGAADRALSAMPGVGPTCSPVSGQNRKDEDFCD
jgi:dienelactone hydrolase